MDYQQVGENIKRLRKENTSCKRSVADTRSAMERLSLLQAREVIPYKIMSKFES